MTVHTTIDRGTPERSGAKTISLEIDGKPVAVPEGTAIRQILPS